MTADRQQVALNQSGLARHDHANGHVGFAHAKVQLVVRQDEAYVDLGIERDELVHLRGQPGRAEAHGGVDLEPPGGLVLVGAQQRLRGIDLGGHVARGPIEQLALFGEDQAARMPMEQHDAKLFLERADLARDRRLAELQRFTGMGEAAGVRHGLEYAQLVPVHSHASPVLAPGSTRRPVRDAPPAPPATSRPRGRPCSRYPLP